MNELTYIHVQYDREIIYADSNDIFIDIGVMYAALEGILNIINLAKRRHREKKIIESVMSDIVGHIARMHHIMKP